MDDEGLLNHQILADVVTLNQGDLMWTVCPLDIKDVDGVNNFTAIGSATISGTPVIHAK